MMRIVHCVPSLHPEHGGPSRTVVALADALARRAECTVALLSQTAPNEPTVLSTEASVDRWIVVGRSRVALALGLPLRQALRRFDKTATVALIHSHGVWHPANHWSTQAAHARRTPLIVQPRGMLEPWALEQKALKKRLALLLFQQRDLNAAQAVVATSEMEYENLRRLGVRQAMAIIPNGVDCLAQGLKPVATTKRNNARVVLFLSRVHPKKGVLELVRAWARVAPVGWRLLIAGPDEGGHWREVSRLIAALGLAKTIDYLGTVEGEEKIALYRSADLFVLPTFSENFGVVVTEALAQGVPVITTRGAPWGDLATYRCGWWIETGVDPLVSALREATALSDAERREMGERGRAYVQRYDWDHIAAETLALYRWLLGRGERPACVYIDCVGAKNFSLGSHRH